MHFRPNDIRRALQSAPAPQKKEREAAVLLPLIEKDGELSLSSLSAARSPSATSPAILRSRAAASKTGRRRSKPPSAKRGRSSL